MNLIDNKPYKKGILPVFMQDQLLEMLMKNDEITWQTLIQDLVKSEEMDPWDVDISKLTKKYLETLSKLQESNFFVSGKVVLAAALLLKIKSDKLLNEDIAEFDNQMNPQELEEFEDLAEIPVPDANENPPQLTIKTPMPRKRRVSLLDLMGALKKALDLHEKREARVEEDGKINVTIPEKMIDITQLIKEVYAKITSYFKKQDHLSFDELVGSREREEKIYTFIPLLHLDAQEKIFLHQDKPFGEIKIRSQ